MSALRTAAGDAPFVFVTGKGGVGKTTAAAALALELADDAVPVRLVSTDPAHSLLDVFAGDPARCSDRLEVEEFDAGAHAAGWLERALGPVAGLVEAGTYLDRADVEAFSRLALPGVDEVMAVLRLVELRGGSRVIVDTAPTGHTLRLLDAYGTHEGLARALRAMAAKAAAVAAALLHRDVRFPGDAIIDELEAAAAAFRDDVLARAAFVIATRPGAVVEAETRRLAAALDRRGLRIAAVVSAGGDSGVPVPGANALVVPMLEQVHGCEGLRRWSAALATGTGAGPVPQPTPETPRDGASGSAWIERNATPLLLIAGKGGVGKTTCAAAIATVLAQSRDVLLCSVDPAGSIDDVLGAGARIPRLRTLQVDPTAQLARLKGALGGDLDAALDRLGLSASAALDRAVIESVADLTPPGVDELAAVAALLDAARAGETIVMDAAPTGHFLRLIETPALALEWVHQLMRIIVRYGIAGVAQDASRALLDLARDLRTLDRALRDPAQAMVIVVTLDEPVVRAETGRLVDRLEAAGLRVGAILVNRATTDTVVAPSDQPILVAPFRHAPAGVSDLRDFMHAWKLVA